MRVLILGIDGYIGRALSTHLTSIGYDVTGIDNYSRRNLAKSLVPLADHKQSVQNSSIKDLTELPEVDAIIHLAEQPSASFSMMDRESAIRTQEENVLGTLNLLWLMRKHCPNAHLIKLGSMGEYGTPNCPIPEGFIEDGEMEGLMFPRTPHSFYHLSKVFDSMNIDFACRVWGLRSTDVMQGIVFGHDPATRFDYDEHFGTVINRFCVQAAAGVPLTVYGSGEQTRGFLPLKDSVECLTLALRNPPSAGEYRVFNQFAETYTLIELAERIKRLGSGLGIEVEIQHIENPRKENESHIYIPKHDKLKVLGYTPKWDLDEELNKILMLAIQYKSNIDTSIIHPKTVW